METIIILLKKHSETESTINLVFCILLLIGLLLGIVVAAAFDKEPRGCAMIGGTIMGGIAGCILGGIFGGPGGLAVGGIIGLVMGLICSGAATESMKRKK